MNPPQDPGAALEGLLLGQALGDALGFVVEARPPSVAAAYVQECLQSGRAGAQARPGFSFGQYTDDTQLARELLRSLDEAGGWRPDLFARRVAALFADGADVGAGPGSRAAAKRLLRGVPWQEAGTPPPYAGNGSAMRAGPLGVLFADDPARLRLVAREQSRVTHLDPRCVAGAVAVAGAAALALRPGPVERDRFVATLADWAGQEEPTVGGAIRQVGGWIDAPPQAAAEALQRAGLDPAHDLGRQGISAFVIPSVAWSLYAFLRHPDDYWAAVCTAIAVGGDTDTMGAIAGALAGARNGTAALPTGWVSRVHDRGAWGAAELGALARRCGRLVGAG